MKCGGRDKGEKQSEASPVERSSKRLGLVSDADLQAAGASRLSFLLIPPDETCGRWLAVALLAGILVLTVICLHFLLAVSTHYAHLVATTAANGCALAGPTQAIRLLLLLPNVHAADMVYAPVHAPAGSALERNAEVWVRAPPAPALKADEGLLDARVVHSKREWI
ncbi:hypothetical protein FB451DRAFT_1566606 [Mycena latifolia]|nr:hypothetical protein FB451DRAFT_1566606 [Mycena latifolia]